MKTEDLLHCISMNGGTQIEGVGEQDTEKTGSNNRIERNVCGDA
jgi:hypothetical protein